MNYTNDEPLGFWKAFTGFALLAIAVVALVAIFGAVGFGMFIGGLCVLVACSK